LDGGWVGKLGMLLQHAADGTHLLLAFSNSSVLGLQPRQQHLTQLSEVLHLLQAQLRNRLFAGWLLLQMLEAAQRLRVGNTPH
jgi:hypothetical protein